MKKKMAPIIPFVPPQPTQKALAEVMKDIAITALTPDEVDILAERYTESRTHRSVVNAIAKNPSP